MLLSRDFSTVFNMDERHAELAVREGAEILDSYPALSGWRHRIDLDTLDLGHAQMCVLGQLYGDYAHAPNFMTVFAAFGGFLTSLDRGKTLTNAWVDYLSDESEEGNGQAE